MEGIGGDGAGQLEILLDHVLTVGGDALGKEPARGALAGVGFTQDARRSGHAGQDGGTDGALEIYDGVVAAGAQLAAQGSQLAEGLRAQRSSGPSLGRGEVEAVHNGLRGSQGSLFPWFSCGEKRLPAGFDGPANLPFRMCPTQGGDRRKGVQDVAHRTEPDDEQAKLGFVVQTSIFAQPMAFGSRILGPLPPLRSV